MTRAAAQRAIQLQPRHPAQVQHSAPCLHLLARVPAAPKLHVHASFPRCSQKSVCARPACEARRHDEEDCGYINASHLRSKDFEQPEWEYIAAQARTWVLHAVPMAKERACAWVVWAAVQHQACTILIILIGQLAFLLWCGGQGRPEHRSRAHCSWAFFHMQRLRSCCASRRSDNMPKQVGTTCSCRDGGVAAAQGPLFETVPDFWRMVYECGSQMVVMLTLTEETNIEDEVRSTAACCCRQNFIKSARTCTHFSAPTFPGGQCGLQCQLCLLRSCTSSICLGSAPEPAQQERPMPVWRTAN